MIEFSTALKKILSHAKRTTSINMPIAKALGCTLAEKVRARQPIPRFDASAVDGFAVNAKDVAHASERSPAVLQLQYVVRAGDQPDEPLAKRSAVKILTGAPVPAGADAIVMKEFVLEGAEEVKILRKAPPESGVRRMGAEFAKGAVVFNAGTLITPPVIGMLATLGYDSVRVYKRPRVAVIVTGNELRPLSVRLKPGEIYDANSYALAAALRAMGIEPVAVAHARDTIADIKAAFAKAMKNADVVIAAGGVSVGDYDFVKDVLAALRVQQVFWSVAMKPGKPVFFGTLGAKLIFALPGNPVSAMVTYETLVRPALRRMLGMARETPMTLKAVLTEDIEKTGKRMEFVRGVLALNQYGEIAVSRTSGQESHMMGGLATANCLIVFPKDKSLMTKGSLADVSLLQWGAEGL